MPERINLEEAVKIVKPFYKGKCEACYEAGNLFDITIIEQLIPFDRDIYVVEGCCNLKLAVKKFHAHQENKKITNER